MKRAALASLALIAPLAACGESEEDDGYVGVCVDPNTGERVEDYYCDEDDERHSTAFAWWWLATRSTYVVPPLHGRVDKSKVVTKVPAGASYKPGGFPTSGGSVKSYVQKSNPGFTAPKAPSGGGVKAPAPAPRPKVGR